MAIGAAAVLGLATGGCSATGAAMEGFRIGKNASEKSSNLKIFLDGNEAAQNKFKKAYFGHASFKVSAPVSTSPTLKYEIIDPTKFGRITSVNAQIHQEFEGDYSHKAEFTIYPASQDSNTLPKSGETISLGSLPGNLKCTNFENQPASGVTLKPGMKYMLVFTLAGDRSESVQVMFDTK
jgi:hypothetical protein